MEIAMDQMTIDDVDVFPTSTPAMIDELKAEIESLTTRLGYAESTRDRFRSQINRFEENLREMLSNGDIDAEMAGELSRCFDFTLDTEVQVTFTITVSGTATIPLGQDVDDIDWENEVSVDLRSYGDIELDVYVDSFDAECEAL
jgi:hypothetical protein